MFYFAIYTEDESGYYLIQELMKKVKVESPGIMYDCYSYRGKTDLLKRLPSLFKGMDKALISSYGKENSALCIVIDSDNETPETLRNKLQTEADRHHLNCDYIFSLAVEEMEAWLMGDRTAIKKAYPKASEKILNQYRQDSISGTWETLADAIYPGGYTKLIKDCKASDAAEYRYVGSLKTEWAKKIGPYMNLDSNLSPSFNRFISAIRIRALNDC